MGTLTIDANEGQSIQIGVNKLTVVSCMAAAVQFRLEMSGEKEAHKFTLMRGTTTQLMHNVSIHLGSVFEGGKRTATLTFNAPQHVRIIGCWRLNKPKRPQLHLHQLTMDEFLLYCDTNARNPLERELMRRLELAYSPPEQ